MILLILISAFDTVRAQIYQIGDVYVFPDSSKGIICYVNPDNPVEGWAVALNDIGWVSKSDNQQYFMIDAGFALPSGMENHLYDDVNGIGRYGLSSWSYEGKKNTRLLLESGHSPAAEAVDFYNGWYIPDAIQMRHIFGLLPFISSAIINAGGDSECLRWMYGYNGSHGHDYWTSTRVNNNQMLVIKGSQYFYSPRTPADHNQPINSNYTTQNRIRAVRDFGTEAYAYWLDKPKSASMVVKPTENTSYNAYVIFNSDTFRITSSAIVYETFDKDTFYEAVCASPVPYTSEVNPIFTALDISHPHDYKTYRKTLQTVHGCDSVITLKLKVNPTHEFTEKKFICQNEAPFIWRGNPYYESGMYYDSLKTKCCGCDSVYVLNLTVAPLPEMSFSPEKPSLCLGSELELSVSSKYCTDYSNPLFEGFDRVTGKDEEITDNLSDMTDLFASGVKVFAAGDSAVRLGNNRTYGKIESKPLDLSHDFTLDLRLMGWIRTGSSEPAATRLRVSVDNIQADTITVPGSNESAPGHYDTYSFNFAAATGSSVLTIEAIDEVAPGSPYAEERVFIDFVRISDNSPCKIEWYKGKDFISKEKTITIQPDVTTTYYVESVSAAGCKNRDTVEVVVYEPTMGDTVAFACEFFTWHGKTYTKTPIDPPVYVMEGGNAHGCDSTVVLHLTIGRVTGDTVAFACGSFTWYEETYTKDGDYTHKFVSSEGCDSVVTLHLTIYESYFFEESAETCSSVPYVWSGHSGVTIPTEVGNHVVWDSLKTVHGCDSVYKLTLKVRKPFYEEQNAETCDNVPYVWSGHSVAIPTAAGSHVVWDSLKTADGCDSVYRLALTIYPTYSVKDTQTVCENALPYTWNGVTFTAASTQMATLKTVHNCDSVVMMTLKVDEKFEQSEALTICRYDLPYTWRDITFPVGTVTGVYDYHRTSSKGCDSVVTLHLTVGEPFYEEQSAETCDHVPYVWSGHSGVTIPTAVGNHVVWDSLKTVHGCDSVYKLTLKVRKPFYEEQNAETCDNVPYVWTGHSVAIPTAAGSHVVWDSLKTADGCDSIYRLALTIYPTYSVKDTQTVCENALPYTWNGVTFTAAGTQMATLKTVHNCDSVVVMTLKVDEKFEQSEALTICRYDLPYTWRDITFPVGTVTGVYDFHRTSSKGCDSVVTLHLTVGEPFYEEQSAETCSNVPYVWIGHSGVSIPTEVGSHVVWDSLKTVHGCDSVYKLTLKVRKPFYEEQNAETCDNVPYVWTGHSVAIPTAAGSHVVWDSLKTADGCDSVYRLALTIYPTYSVKDTQTVCENALPYTWNGVTFTAASTQMATLKTVHNCDSVVMMTLKVDEKFEQSEALTICRYDLPYTWRDITFPVGTVTGVYDYHRTSSKGCDSVVTLRLTVGEPFYEEQSAETCDNVPYVWTGHSVSIPTVAGTHIIWDSLKTSSDCDSVYKLTLKINKTYYWEQSAET
ncbi:MAG: hypothetical protein J5644_04560, partial [Bacteroidales bacterium]|nr:hypothetical protein [Bacteroidales bacterium]